MGITVRRAKKRHGSTARNWCVRHELNFASIDLFEPGCPIGHHHFIRIYTCTNWTDAMRIADDLANERTIDPNRIIALSERRV